MKLQILLLGATGRTGQLLLQEAIQRNYTIHVLVRDPAKISSHPNLTIFEGSPANLPALQKAALGCEAILSTLNISRKNDFPWSKLRTPTHFLSEVIKNILQTDIQRVIVTSAWGVAETKKDIPIWFRWLIKNSNIGVAYYDHELQECFLQNSSVNFTVVRPVGLTNSSQEQTIQVTLENNMPKPKLTISRLSTAKFMLDCLEHHLFIRKKPIISAQS